jgi:hypothetical protein
LQYRAACACVGTPASNEEYGRHQYAERKNAGHHRINSGTALALPRRWPRRRRNIMLNGFGNAAEIEAIRADWPIETV